MNRSGFVKHRQTWGDQWLSIFEDKEIPWRQLSLQEFLTFDALFRSGKYTEAEIEDEVFSLICLDKIYTENIDILPAGAVSSVVAHCMMHSGPASVEQINHDLNIARVETSDFISSAVTLICSVFVAYKPEDLYSLKYPDFMKRLAQAEKRLLELGVIVEPISVLNPQEAAPKPQKNRKKIVEKFADLNPPPVQPATSQTVITKEQMASRDVSAHDLTDKALWQHDALQGLEFIYPEYFKLIKEGKKITPEVINRVKGDHSKEVEEKHEEYVQKILKGDLKPQPSKFLIADKLESGSVRDKAKKMKVSRIKG